jgi:phosphoribosylglycinamide formyltransferase 1
LSTPARIAVFASGGGTNLQALIEYFNGGKSPYARVELVVVSRSGAGALTRAEQARVPAVVVDPGLVENQGASEMLGALGEHRIDLIALAGYLKLVPTEVIEAYQGRVVNIHPALLPGFGGPGMYGLRVHRAVIASGATVTGASVHLVNERYDEGRILAQWPVPVLRGDTPELLAERVLRVEHLLYPRVIESVVRAETAPRAEGALSFDLVAADAPPDTSIQSLLR